MNERKESLEERLAAADFSDRSAIRYSLRRELLDRIARNDPGGGRSRPQWGRFEMFKRPMPAFGLGIFVAALALVLAHPDGRAALAKLPGLLHIGEHTGIFTESQFSSAQLDSLLAASDVSQEKGQSVFQATPYGGWGSTVPPGGDPFIKEVCSLSLAAGMVDHPLLVPTYFHPLLPDRLRFQKAVIMPNGSTMLYFGVGHLETVLMLTSVANGGMVSYMESATTIAEDGSKETTYVQPELEELEVDGRTVTWLKHSEGARWNLGGIAVTKTDTEIGRFLWEQEGWSCALNGKFLTKDEGLKIIASLRTFSVER
ncbi:MAG: hypothetical protein ABIK96_11800 [bacterium]